MSIFTHLVEVVGGLSLLATRKRKPSVTGKDFIPKAIAWWLSLCGKAGVKSVEDMLWAKFPGVCPYCHSNPHDPNICSEAKAARPGPDWDALATIAGKSASGRPRSLGDWQRMYSSIFPAQQTEDYGVSFGRLAEELGELAEAVRVFSAAPGYFLSEASDVFAWLMHIENIVELQDGVARADRGRALELAFCRSYPDACQDCGSAKCTCPPILEATIGRIAHEVPGRRGTFDQDGSFMTADRARAVFGIAPRYGGP